MSNDIQPAPGVVAYRVVRELGSRAQRTFAAIRDPHELVTLHRFGKNGAATPQGSTPVSSEQLAMLVRDAQSLAKNWHPNIARVKHVDLGQGNLSISTELLDGTTLADLIALAAARKTAFPLDVLVRISLDVLAGVHGIHSLRDGRSVPLGAIHGELCPANIVVGRDGVARVINTFRPRPLRIVAASEAIGYVAPETLDGGSLDARVDVYAVGVILWEVLSGKKLLDEKEPARVLTHLREVDIPRPPAPSDMAYAPLAHIAMRALSFEPSLRFRTAMEMSAALRALPSDRIATGSVVAARVNELDGERIRGRRAALDRDVSSRPRVAALAKTPANPPPVRPSQPSVKSEERSPTVPDLTAAAEPAPPSSSDLVENVVEEAAPSTTRGEASTPRPPAARPRIMPVAKPAKVVATGSSATSTAKGLGGPSSATSTAKGLGGAPPPAPSSNRVVAAVPAPAPAAPAPSSNPVLAAPKPQPSSNRLPVSPVAPSSNPIPLTLPLPPSSNPIAVAAPVAAVPVAAAPPVAAPPVAPPAVVVAPPPPAVVAPPLSSPIATGAPSSAPMPIAEVSRAQEANASSVAEREKLVLASTSGGLNASLDLELSDDTIIIAPPPRRRRALIIVAAILSVAIVILLIGVIGGRGSSTQASSSPPPPGVGAKPAEPTATIEPSPVPPVPTVNESATTTTAVVTSTAEPSVAPPALPASTEAAPSNPVPAAPTGVNRPAPVSVSPPSSASGKRPPPRRYEPLGI